MHPQQDPSSPRRGKALVPIQEPQPSRASGKTQGNPFAEDQERHKLLSERGKQVSQRLIDVERIYPSIGGESGQRRMLDALENRVNTEAETFVHGALRVLPADQPKAPSGLRTRRLSGDRDTSFDYSREPSSVSVGNQPRQRLRLHVSDEQLAALMPVTSTERQRAHEIEAMSRNAPSGMVDAMLQHNYPISHGNPCTRDLPPVHVKQTPRKHESQLPFGPQGTHAEPLEPAKSGLRVFPSPPIPLVEDFRTGKRIALIGEVVPSSNYNPITLALHYQPPGNTTNNHGGGGARGIALAPRPF